MRRLINVILSAALLFSLTVPVFATDSNITDENPPLYIASTACPQDYIDFAEENISKFVASMGENVNYSTITVGSPFAFADYDADVYYFPVICDGTIKYLFRVYPDGASYSAAITAFLAKDIEELASLTSPSTPMFLNRIGAQIVATIGTESYLLFEYPENMAGDNYNRSSTAMIDYTIVNAKRSSEIELSLYQARDVSKNINLNIIETQGQDNWCTAYCLATIIRTKTPYYQTGYGLAVIALGANPDTQKGFPYNQVYIISGPYGLYPTVSYTTISNSSVMAQINADKPVMSTMRNSADNLHHTVLIRGYNTVGVWNIWNPWFMYYESYSMTGSYVPTGYPPATHSFTSYMHAYNFG